MPIGDRIKNASSMMAFAMMECAECSPLSGLENHAKTQHTVQFAGMNSPVAIAVAIAA
jgi:hypothetical protein